jgi:hypothetical protein
MYFDFVPSISFFNPMDDMKGVSLILKDKAHPFLLMRDAFCVSHTLQSLFVQA